MSKRIIYLDIPLEDGTTVTYDATNDRFLSAIESLLLSSSSMKRAIVAVDPEVIEGLQEAVVERLDQ